MTSHTRQRSWTCRYCTENIDVMCPAETRDGLFCTRLDGHDGPHIACGGPGWHDIKRWDDG